MESRYPLLLIGLVATSLTTSESLAQNGLTKKDALAALDELTFDNNRFERLIGLARSLGVSDAAIVNARFDRAFYTGDIDGMKRMLPDLEKALATMPADEGNFKADEIRKVLPQFKKIFESGDQTRAKTLLEKYQRQAEARSILTDLIRIDAAVDICAIELNLKAGTVVASKEWVKRVKQGSQLQETGADIFGVLYGNQIVDQTPKPNPASQEKVSKYVPADFFNSVSPANRP